MYKIYGCSILICFTFFYNLSHCAKILGVFPSPGYSQYILAESLLIALAERGQNVTVISGFKTKGVPNLNNIVIDFVKDDSEKLFKLQELSVFSNIISLHEMGLVSNEALLSNDKVQALIHSAETFDLVIIETFVSEALQAFSTHFNAHQVLFSSIAASEWNTHLVGIPNIPSYLPNTFSGYTTHMKFSERFRNTLAFWYDKYYKAWYTFPAHQKLVDKYFPMKYNLQEFIYDASLMLTCSHVSTSETLPLTASVVEVGGLHIKLKKLPENIQNLLDSATNGAIFFSLGSNLQSSTMSNKTIVEIMSVLGSLRQQVLWKFEDENLENKPDNLMISKWFPQNDILAHPNTVAFISHCGMGSTTETVFHGVPVMGIPMFGDQFMNVRKLVNFGMAIELPFQQISTKTFNDTIQRILFDKRYREAAKRRSKIMQDRPLKPLDEAVYWVEYVLKYDGAHHLRGSILDLSWYQLYLLDILLVILTSLILLCYCIYIFFCVLKRQVQKHKVKLQ